MTGSQPTLKLQSIHARHAHIEDQAVRIREMIRMQKFWAEANTITPNPTERIKPLGIRGPVIIIDD